MRIVTGYLGSAHITSEDDQALNRGIFTSTNGLIGSFDFRPSTSGFTLTIAKGEGMLQGVHFRIPYGETETVTLTEPASGYWRKDAIYVKYTKNTSTGVEGVEWYVLEGTPVLITSGDATAPAVADEGDLAEGDTTAYMLMYIATVAPAGITAITQEPSTISSLNALADDVNVLYANQNHFGYYNGSVNPNVTSTFSQDPIQYITASAHYPIWGGISYTEGLLYNYDNEPNLNHPAEGRVGRVQIFEPVEEYFGNTPAAVARFTRYYTYDGSSWSWSEWYPTTSESKFKYHYWADTTSAYTFNIGGNHSFLIFFTRVGTATTYDYIGFGTIGTATAHISDVAGTMPPLEMSFSDKTVTITPSVAYCKCTVLVLQ